MARIQGQYHSHLSAGASKSTSVTAELAAALVVALKEIRHGAGGLASTCQNLYMDWAERTFLERGWLPRVRCSFSGSHAGVPEAVHHLSAAFHGESCCATASPLYTFRVVALDPVNLCRRYPNGIDLQPAGD